MEALTKLIDLYMSFQYSLPFHFYRRECSAARNFLEGCSCSCLLFPILFATVLYYFAAAVLQVMYPNMLTKHVFLRVPIEDLGSCLVDSICYVDFSLCSVMGD
jgi:hypothetical protein